MKVAVLHARYLHEGGEEAVFEAECTLLKEAGHSVCVYEVSNRDLAHQSVLRQARGTIWNKDQYEKITAFLKSEQPHIAHFHNTFPLISPSGYYAAKRANVPVVQTLHNYRILCANGLLYRDGHVCEDCLGRNFPAPALRHRCYRSSLPATAAVVAMQYSHRLRHTWNKRVHAFIPLTEFAKSRFIKGGLAESRLHVKPNFLSPDPGVGTGYGNFALFVGRLSYEKGIQTLVDAWLRVPQALTLKIVGDGPEADLVTKAATSTNVEWLGRLPKRAVLEQMKEAAVLVFPSVCYENMPLVIPEAYACGLPVLATNLPSLDSLVSEDVTGKRFRVGDPDDLSKVAMWCTENLADLKRMRAACRNTFEEQFTAPTNLARLMEIYQSAIATYQKHG